MQKKIYWALSLISICFLGVAVFFFFENQQLQIELSEMQQQMAGADGEIANDKFLKQIIEEYHLPAGIFQSKKGNSPDDYFLLYNGALLDPQKDYQATVEIMKAEYDIDYFERFYYGPNGYISIGVPTDFYEDSFIVQGVGRIASSYPYDMVPCGALSGICDGLPMEWKEPIQLDGLIDYDSITYQEFDLDGDGRMEYLVCLKNSKTVSSQLILFNNSGDCLGRLVTLKNGSEYGREGLYLSQELATPFDVDNDGIVELVISIPAYEPGGVAIVRYDGEKLVGAKDIEATLAP